MQQQKQQLIKLTDIPALREAGLPFDSEHSVRWAHRRRHERGTADAFIRHGRNILLDPDRYHELVRRQSTSAE